MEANSNKLRNALSIVVSSILILTLTINVAAVEKGTSTSLDAGAAVVLDADILLESDELAKIAQQATSTEEAKKTESVLVMTNVKDALNIRATADEKSEKVGKLYKDCGGEILERSNGWTKLKSGDLIGWAKDEYLLFDEEAQALAEQVGYTIATINTDALRVRKAMSQDAGVLGLVGMNEELDTIEVKTDWVAVDYEGEVGYVASEYVSVEFRVDHGETMASIEKRAADEAAAKAKLNVNYEAMTADVSDVTLLAALIQCEAGGESYEGQLAVGAVVMNRVRSSGYPDTISGVIYMSGQFTPAMSGKVASRIEKGIKDSCMQAAQEAINGVSNVGGATRFRRVGKNEGIVIGNHVFW